MKEYSVDEMRIDKSNKSKRVVVPYSLRNKYDLNESVLIPYEKCLRLFPLKYLEVIVNSLTGHEESRRIRIVCSQSYECGLDEMGRIRLPTYLTEPAGIKDSVIFVDFGEGLQIWNPEEWKRCHN